MASRWEARAATQVVSGLLCLLAHSALPAYDMLQFDGFEACAWKRKEQTVSKGRWASSSVLEEGTASAQAFGPVCSSSDITTAAGWAALWGEK